MITSLWGSSVITRVRSFLNEGVAEERQTVIDNRKYQISLPRKMITDSGKRLRVDSFIDSGGQGEVYRAFLENHAHPVALKLYHRSQATAIAKKRIKILAKSRLDQLDCGICAPFDTITSDGLIGHIAPFAEGKTLLEFLEEGSLTYPEVFEVALQVVDLTGKLVERGITQGDLQTQNFKLNRTGGRLQVFMIDLDNFSAKGAPKPNMLGMTLYIAPELREGFKTGKQPLPTELSDRYSMGVLLHEILLHFHPIAGFDETIDDINDSMTSDWKYDPSLPSAPRNPHGYPVTTLSPSLITLLRRSLLSTPRRYRPRSKEWHQALESASQNLGTCQECGIPYVCYSGRCECPLGHPVQFHALRLGNHQEVSLSGLVTVLGRHELGGDKAISRRHLIIREIGSKLYVESIGMNPTSILDGAVWRPLVYNQLNELKPNDRLMVANTLLLYST